MEVSRALQRWGQVVLTGEDVRLAICRSRAVEFHKRAMLLCLGSSVALGKADMMLFHMRCIMLRVIYNSFES